MPKSREIFFGVPFAPFVVDSSKLLSNPPMSIEEARQLLDKLNEEFPQVEKWVKKMKEKSRRDS